jgi:sulfur-carrier protein
MQITVYGPLRSATGEKTVTVAFDGGTVEDALTVFVENYPRAKSQLYTTDGRLQISARISINGERVNLDDDCPADAELTVFPAVQGGVKKRLLDRCEQKRSVKEYSEREI